MKKTAITALFLAFVLSASPVMAKNDNTKGGGKGSEKYKVHERGNSKHDNISYDYPSKKGDKNDKVLVNLDFHKIDTISSELRPYYIKKCPPGLARKSNGCLPPGQAKKYVVGYPLPDDVIFWDVPHSVLIHLPPAPRYSRYVWVDKDVLLISEATKKVLDALVLLSAVD